MNNPRLSAAPHRRAAALILVGLVLAIICGLFFAWLGEEVLGGDTVRFDDHVRTLVHAESQPDLTRALTIVTGIGSTVPVVAFTLAALAVFWWRGMRRDAVALAVAMIGAAILTQILKLGFHRPRPTPYFGLSPPNSFSFPSGHSLMAFCFYAVLAHLISSRIRPAAARAGIWTFAVLMILLIGFSRIYLGVHYPSDVIAGYAAGAVWVLAAVLAEPFIGYWLTRRRV